MKRRSAIKNLSLAFAGMVSLPAWVSGWTPESIGQVNSLTVPDENLLAEITETIIPETQTPGAKSLKVHQFVMRMIQDCSGEAAQTNLEQGLLKTDELANIAYKKPFMACDAAQRIEILTHLQTSNDPVGKQFVDMVKNLTIRGYMNSEYVLTNIYNYNIAPGFYHGCVPIKA
ncbi:gluconate 2-dehydrogenase subunit 3 family protein [Adhaeribacter radiodurans]|uniref:Gluconate 2-dehydrogenase subunit 3 family protein n=1 Tax=Adhaeribacter radiodurans TaxID=2745197 RepID=A0A7L7L842_9BACT|nr:gluconate 2-dehydrogenase subunit 3 family protein [Adhaeribacter radiodurans]QMU29011.1 gluconate 2-dehydrogenase subunit 3 family protein [Adhaeribacter radiodurans]